MKLSGSAAAYAGINPKSTGDDHGTEVARLVIAVTGDSAPPRKATNSPAPPGHSATPGSTTGYAPSAPKTAR
ncbi:hypothetical protein ACWEN3_45205 [Streptomyces sp. NPDC004561]